MAVTASFLSGCSVFRGGSGSGGGEGMAKGKKTGRGVHVLPRRPGKNRDLKSAFGREKKKEEATLNHSFHMAGPICANKVCGRPPEQGAEADGAPGAPLANTGGRGARGVFSRPRVSERSSKVRNKQHDGYLWTKGNHTFPVKQPGKFCKYLSPKWAEWPPGPPRTSGSVHNILSPRWGGGGWWDGPF